MAQQLPHHHLHKSFPAQTPLINQHGMQINSKALNDTQQYWLMLARTPAYDCKYWRELLHMIVNSTDHDCYIRSLYCVVAMRAYR